jgi:hypothetical protein
VAGNAGRIDPLVINTRSGTFEMEESMRQDEPPSPTSPWQQIRGLSSIWQFFSLKPYGNDLLTTSAQSWIALVRISSVCIALTEAMAWGYAGRLLFPTNWLAPALMGLFIFLLTWGITSSLMMLDLRLRNSRNGTNRNGRTRLRLAFPVAIRSFLLILCLLISAPFIQLAVFEKDIDRHIEIHFAREAQKQQEIIRARIDTERIARTDSLKIKEEEIKSLSNRLMESQREHDNELRRGGSGPLSHRLEIQAKVAALQLEEKNQELLDIKKSFDRPLPSELELVEFFTTLERRDMNQLTSRWGVSTLSGSFSGRSTILAKYLAGNDEVRRAEITIISFLLFSFSGLAMLKLFEPKSVQIYFSAELQDAWTSYQQGAFDRLLPPGLASTVRPSSMTAFYFESFILDTYNQLVVGSSAKKLAAPTNGGSEADRGAEWLSQQALEIEGQTAAFLEKIRATRSDQLRVEEGDAPARRRD